MSWFKRTDAKTTRRRNKTNRKLRPELLHKREMMAGDFVDSTVNENTGVMHITGTNDNDKVEVFIDNRGTSDLTDDIVKVKATYSDGRVITAGQYRYNLDGTLRVQSLKFEGFDGDDLFRNSTGYDSVAHGGDGDDVLIGGYGVDRFFGELGKDRLYGRSGSDVLDGGRDADVILGSWGNDTLRGGHGNDWIGSGWGDDSVRGGSGNDTIYGDHGDDEIFGDSGHDKVYGGYGNDIILGGSGNDNLNGNRGNDSIMGESGKDLIQGNEGDDFLYGGRHDDTLYGNTGNDLIVGGDGSDIVSGNQGNDRLYGGDMSGLNLNLPGYGNPTLHKKSDAQDWDKDHLAGGSGHDWFGIADNGLFSDDKVHDRESGETVRDLDPWGTTAGTGRVYFAANYGHLKED